MKWYPVPEIRNLDQPFIKRVKAGGKNICFVGYQGEIFALSTWCPHAGADLSQGSCEHAKLICPFHGYSYDLRTGKGSHGQNDYINTYPVKIKTQTLYVGIGSFWDKIKQAFS